MPDISPFKRLKQSRSQVTVTVNAEETAKAEAQALGHLSHHVDVQGFRPGKAPAEMVRSKVNEEALLEETVRSFLPTVMESVIKQNDLKPILAPRVEVQSKSPLTIVITFVERPEVTVKEIDKKQLAKTAPKFDDKDIDRMVNYLLEQYRTTTPVDRAAQEGDQVTLDFVGMGEDGQELAGTRSTGYPVVIGSKTLIPGFEDGLKGITLGEKRDLKLTFPEKYHAEHLRGKPVTFSVEAKAIDQVHTPSLTPEFVKEKGLGASPEDVRKRIAESMTEEENRMDRDRREQLFFDLVRKATTVDIAPELLIQEQQALVEEIARQLEAQKLNFQDWLTRSKRTQESFQKEIEEEATRRVTLRFGMQKLLEDHKIEATPEELRDMIVQTLAELPEAQRAQAAQYYTEGNDGYEELKWRKRVEKMLKMMLE